MGSFPPNILQLMADHITASALPVYANQVCQTPHLSALASGKPDLEAVDAIGGTSLAPLLDGHIRNKAAGVFAAEFTGEDAIAPMVAVRKGDYKLIASLVDSTQLFNLADDPQELHNLAGSEDTKYIKADLQHKVGKRWKLDEMNTAVLGSQKRWRWIRQQLVH